VTVIDSAQQAPSDSHAMSTLQIHPVAAQLPLAQGASFDALVRDMQLNGQHLPIVLYEGMVWDGRARLSACINLGIKPWLVPLRRRDPMHQYIISNYPRCGEPRSPERNEVIDTLSKAGSPDFKDLIRGRREPCAVCRKHIEFVHAHHSFPFSLQFECGVDEPIHDYQWLCPVHHKYVHVLLSGHLLGSRDLSFLDCIRDDDTEEWLAIERSAQEGFDLCCEALGRVPGENKPRRYDPEYGLYLINNPSVVRQAAEWSRSQQRPSSAVLMASRSAPMPMLSEPAAARTAPHRD
jgi:hypothetical protein